MTMQKPMGPVAEQLLSPKMQKKAVDAAYERGFNDGWHAALKPGIREDVAKHLAENLNWSDGHRQGWKDAAEECMARFYSACAIALHDLNGFGPVRGARVLERIRDQMELALDAHDLVREAEKKVRGLHIEIGGAEIPDMSWEDE